MNNTTNEYNLNNEQVRPWIRFWARWIDTTIFLIIATLILIAVIHFIPYLTILLQIPDTLYGIIFLFTYVFIEAFLLSTLGTTPGKTLFKIKLRDKNHKKLSYKIALRRSFTVWYVGLGIGFPLIQIITQIYAYKHLKKHGITSWDSDENLNLSHQKIGIGRIVIASIFILGFIFLIIQAR